VIDRWSSSAEGDVLQEYAKLQRILDRMRTVWLRGSGLLKFRKEFEAYGRMTRALFQAIRDCSGKRIIVTSSKNPARALFLSRVDGLQTHLIHLIRDGRGVAWSYQKLPDTKLSTWRVTLKWWWTNKMAERALRDPKVVGVQIRYEDLVLQPEATLDRLSTSIGVPLRHLGEVLKGGGELKPLHIMSGNRFRMEGSFTLLLDEEWKERLSPFDRLVFWILAGRLAARYGYQRKPVGV
jgi:hypothetical protein